MRVVGFVALVALVCATACSGSDDTVRVSESPPGSLVSPAPSPTTEQVGSEADRDPSADAVTADPAAFSDAGIVVVADEAAAPPVDDGQGPLVLTAVQRDRLLATVNDQSGWLGVEIDELAPVPAGAPPTSYFIAAWINVADTPASRTSADWMGEQDWQHAQDVRFPLAVVALFVNDIAHLTDEAAVTDGSIQLPPAPSDSVGLMRAAAGPLAAPCTVAQNFIANVFAGIVNALHIPSPSGTGLFVDVLNRMIDIVNFGVRLASGVLRTVVDTITAPVFDAIRTAVAMIGLATVVASYLTDQQLTVTLAPSQRQQMYRFSIGTEPDIRGAFVARSKDLTGQWPPALLNCATAVGATLPSPVQAGTPATWTIEQAPPVIAAPPIERVVDTDLTARFDFVTGRETDDQARGELTNSRARAHVVIVRSEVQQMATLGKQLLDNALKQLAERINLLRIPGGTAAIVATIKAITDPIIADLQRSIIGAGGKLLATQGRGVVYVDYHLPPEPPTTPEPTPPSTPPTTAPRTTPPKPDNACQALPTEVVLGAAGVPLQFGPHFSPELNMCVWDLDVNSGDAAVTLWIIDGAALEQLRVQAPALGQPLAGLGWPAWGGTSVGEDIESIVFVDLGTWGIHLVAIAPVEDDAGMRTDVATLTGLAAAVIRE